VLLMAREKKQKEERENGGDAEPSEAPQK